MRAWIAVVVIGALVGLGNARPDPGILLTLDRELFELRARDERDGTEGPVLRVALGSPAHPTPTGVFPLRWIILNPAWTPGPTARKRGAEPQPPGLSGPMGVAKIPFAGEARVALHGGGISLLLGKPITGGCIRAADADLLTLIRWLTSRGALAEALQTAEGEVRRPFRRPARLSAP
jgi:hypothetical protein